MFRFLRSYPLLFPCLGTLLGIVLAFHWDGAGRWSWAVGIAMVLACLVLFWPSSTYYFQNILLGIFCFGLALLTVGDYFFTSLPKPLSTWVQERTVQRIILKAHENCQSRGGRSKFRGRVLGWFEGDQLRPVSFPVIFGVGSPGCSVQSGGYYQSLASFRLPSRFQNPSSFDYPTYLRVQGLWANAYIKGEEYLVPIGSAPQGILPYLAKLREEIWQGIQRAVPDGEVRGLFATLLLRKKDALEKKTEEAFRQAGISHLLVVSGLHLGLVFSFFFFLFYLLFSLARSLSQRGYSRPLALLASLIPTYLYVGMVGLSPSVLRALSLISLMVLAYLLRLTRNFFSFIILAAWLLLLWEPKMLFDLSFQLSFLSVSALYIFGQRFGQALTQWGERFSIFRPRVLRWIFLLMLSTFAINAVLFPILAKSFHEVSLWAPLANLLWVPLVTFLLLPGLLGATLLYLIWPNMGLVLFSLLAFPAQWALDFTEWFLQNSYGSLWAIPLSGWAWLGYGLFLFSLFNIAKPRKLIFGVLSLLIVLFFIQGQNMPGSLELTLVDVGQGEAMILRLPEGKAIVVDGGGFPHSDFDVGRNVLIPALLRKGITSLEAVVMTHPDADHYKGLMTLAEHFPVKEFWLSAHGLDQAYLRHFSSLLEAKKIPLRHLVQGEVWKWGEVSFTVLWPPQLSLVHDNPMSLSDNDQSLVFRICHLNNCLLLTGDIEEGVERLLAQSGIPLHSQVLKLAHHGSSTSSSKEFFEKVRPQLALISAGRQNRFSFPHPEVLARLKKQGVKILRTDLHGQIQIWLGKNGIRYKTYSGEEGEVGD